MEPPQHVQTPPAPETEQQAADRLYVSRLRALTPQQLDFVRQDKLWPAFRTAKNPMATPLDVTEETRKNNDFTSQKNRNIKNTFIELRTAGHNDSVDVDGMARLKEEMFDGGRYSWVLATADVIRAVQARWGGAVSCEYLLCVATAL
eukprot:COSAG01_NODE_2558_length_7455_cov_164.011963_2_plen_147_part_00